MTRESLHARIADILRRSEVEDCDQLVRAMEQDAAEFVVTLNACIGLLSVTAPMPLSNEIARVVRRINRAIAGEEIGAGK